MKRILLSLMLLPFAAFGLAQDSLMYSLDEIVVSASRWCQQSQAQPVKVARLSFDEANAFNPQTAADVLGLTGEYGHKVRAIMSECWKRSVLCDGQ